MKFMKLANTLGIGMILGSVPSTIAILLFFSLMAIRKAGSPIGGDALGLMMISVLAYSITLLSFTCGALYFAYAVFKNNLRLKTWHWFSIAYSGIHIILPIIYFSNK
jgi:hypothetical protein